MDSAQPLLLDINAAAKFLGVGAGTMRTFIANGIPFVRAGRGGKRMFIRKDLERWIERMKESAQ